MRCAQIIALAALLVTTTGCLQYYHPDSLSGVNGPGPGGGMLAKYDAVEAAHAWQSYCANGYNENIFSGFAEIEGSWFNVDCWRDQWEARQGQGFFTQGILTRKLAGGSCGNSGGIAGIGQILPGRGLCRDGLFGYKLVRTDACTSCDIIDGDCSECGSCEVSTVTRPGLLHMLRNRPRITDVFGPGTVVEDSSCQCSECPATAGSQTGIIAEEIEVPLLHAPVDQIQIENGGHWQQDYSTTPYETYPEVQPPYNNVVPPAAPAAPGTTRQLEPENSPSTRYYPDQPYDSQPAYQDAPRYSDQPDFQQQLVQPNQGYDNQVQQQPLLTESFDNQWQPMPDTGQSYRDSSPEPQQSFEQQPVARQPAPQQPQQPLTREGFTQQIMEPFGVQPYARSENYQPQAQQPYQQQVQQQYPNPQQYGNADPGYPAQQEQMPVVDVEQFEPQSIITDPAPQQQPARLQANSQPRIPEPVEPMDLTPNEHGLVIGPNLDFSASDQYSQDFAGDLSEPMEAITASEALPQSPMLPDSPERDFQSVSSPDNDPFDNYDVEPLEEAPPVHPEMELDEMDMEEMDMEFDNPFEGGDDPFGNNFPAGRNRRPVRHVAQQDQPIILRARPTVNHSMSNHSRQLLEQDARIRAASSGGSQVPVTPAGNRRLVDEFGLPAGELEFRPLPEQNAPLTGDTAGQPLAAPLADPAGPVIGRADATQLREIQPQTNLIPPMNLEERIREEVNRQLQDIEDSRQPRASVDPLYRDFPVIEEVPAIEGTADFDTGPDSTPAIEAPVESEVYGPAYDPLKEFEVPREVYDNLDAGSQEFDESLLLETPTNQQAVAPEAPRSNYSASRSRWPAGKRDFPERFFELS